MVILLKSGNIFDSGCQTLVNAVNCVGNMGKGIALDFRQKFPSMYEDYHQKCTSHELRPGCPYVFKQKDHPWILNFPTKDKWWEPSKLDYLIRGMRHIWQNYKDWGIESIAFPALGCGEGKLDWEQVYPILLSWLNSFDISIELFCPLEKPLHI